MYNTYLGMHWGKRKKVQDEFLSLINAEIRDIIPKQSINNFRLVLFRFSYKEVDFDGLVGSFKLVIDCLEKLQVISNDSIANTGTWYVEHIKVSKKKDCGIRVILVPL